MILSYIEYSDSVLSLFSETSQFLIRYEDRYAQAPADSMAVVRFYHERKGKYLEDALNGKVRDVLVNDDITAVQLWDAISSSKEGKQYLRELNRLQMMHSSAEVRNTINNTIALIDNYIQ